MSDRTRAAEYRPLGDATKLHDDDVLPYYIADVRRRVSIARVGGTLYAFDDLYEGHPLSSGLLTGTTIMSQCDGSQFDITTGSVLRGPATRSLDTYEVREHDGKIELKI